MVYRGSRWSATGYRKKRPTTSARLRAAAVSAARGRSIPKAIRSISETKYTTTNFNETSVALLGTFYDLSDVAGGYTAGTRIGHRIYVTGVRFRFVVAASATDENNIVRIMFGRSRTGALDTDAYPGNLYDFIDSDKITTLRDFSVTSQLNNAADGVAKKFVSGWIPINRQINFDTETSTTVMNGQIGLKLISDSAAPPYPSVTGAVRVYFKDV